MSFIDIEGRKHRMYMSFILRKKAEMQKDRIWKGDTMSERKAIIEAGWNFDNSYARLPKELFTILGPNPVPSPKLIIFN